MNQILLCVCLIVAWPFRQPSTAVECALRKSAYNLLFATVKINGKEVSALIDSGSFRAIQLSATLAGELHLPLTDTNKVAKRYEGKELRLKRGRIEQFVLGGLTRRELEVEVIEGDIENIARQVGTNFDVILGWGFLSQFRTTVDYKTLTLRLSNAARVAGAPKLSFEYTVINGVPVITGELAGQPIKLLFDTGAPMCNLDPEIAQIAKGEKVSKEVTIAGRQLNLQFRVKELTPIKQSLGCVGVIGNNFLDRYEVYFDTANRRVHLY